MKNDIQNILGDAMANSIEGLVTIYDKLNLTSEQIAEKISDMHEITREGMHLTALSSGNKELAEKIKHANELIKQKRIDSFKQSVANGTHEEFLANMSWTDKISLEVEMNLDSVRLLSKTPLTPQEELYLSLIENSIDKDIEKEALSQGFPTVEAWRRHNEAQSSHHRRFQSIIKNNR